jgi:hypothetical protein
MLRNLFRALAALFRRQPTAPTPLGVRFLGPGEEP